MPTQSNKAQISILFHNYYGSESSFLAAFESMEQPYQLFWNGVAGSYYRLQSAFNWKAVPAVTTTRAFLHVTNGTNQGKDVGGKLLMLDAYMRLQQRTPYLLLLHDKRSPYHSSGEQWQKKLLSIAHKANAAKAIELFERDDRLGLITVATAIKNEIDNDLHSDFYTDSAFIKELHQQYHIHPPTTQYAAGTMFFVRSFLYEEFFSSYSPLLIRASLEAGNVTDLDAPTHSHAWERLLSWIITSRGYKIKGI